jgi:hypothetical protein
MRITEAHDYDLIGGLIDSVQEDEPLPRPQQLLQILPMARPQTTPVSR